jgi:hypothetical protein
MKTGCFGSLL